MNFSNVTSIVIPEGNVTQIAVGGTVLWKKSAPTPVSEPFYLTNEDTQQITVSIKKIGTNATNAPTITLQVSDDGNTWTSLGNSSTTALNITIPVGGKKYLRSTSANAWCNNNGNRTQFSTSTGKFGARGSIMTLLGYNTLKGYDCQYMFQGCTGLTVAPELPATTLAQKCYYYMFYGCTSLIESPELPATTLVSECYDGMFRDCTSLNKITCNARIDSSYYISYWVYNVAASGTFYKNPLSSWNRGTGGIPSGWTVADIQ